ncbi:hypothetical protein C0993_001084, partial [Termitomyces sp. T159_Od127]
MHFKSLVVIAAGLAAFASASPVDNLLGTAVDKLTEPILSLGDFLDPRDRLVKTTDPYRQGCRALDVERIKKLKMKIDSYNRKTIAGLRKVIGKTLFIPEFLTIEDYRSNPPDGSSCQDLWDLERYYVRMV